jgi:antitoxin component HigA of HigAB toxin-antitoxin module
MKINESKLKKIIAEEMAAIEDKQYFDHVDEEGQMAKRQLEQLAEYANELASMLGDDTQLEGWVQSKITLAKDYISKVKHYLEDELEMKSPGCGETQDQMMVEPSNTFEITDELAELMES